jgi:hypothetical protein
MNLHQKIVEIRKEIDAFSKDTQGFNYSYVSGSQALGKIQDKMNELGVLLYPEMDELQHSTFDYQQYNKKTKQMDDKTDFVISGNMKYVWQNAENPEEKILINWNIYGQQDDISKAFGSALTYSERYFLLKFFNAPTDDDDPDTRQTPKGKGSYGNNKASSKQLDFVQNLLKGKVTKEHTYEALYTGIKKRLNTDVDMESWTPQQASQAIGILQGDKK